MGLAPLTLTSPFFAGSCPQITFNILEYPEPIRPVKLRISFPFISKFTDSRIPEDSTSVILQITFPGLTGSLVKVNSISLPVISLIN